MLSWLWVVLKVVLCCFSQVGFSAFQWVDSDFQWLFLSSFRALWGFSNIHQIFWAVSKRGSHSFIVVLHCFCMNLLPQFPGLFCTGFGQILPLIMQNHLSPSCFFLGFIGFPFKLIYIGFSGVEVLGCLTRLLGRDSSKPKSSPKTHLVMEENHVTTGSTLKVVQKQPLKA